MHSVLTSTLLLKTHLPHITDNPNLAEMFAKDSIFCAYKRSNGPC